MKLEEIVGYLPYGLKCHAMGQCDSNNIPETFTIEGFDKNWDWDEVHCCEDCETKYWFSNGAY